MLSFLIRACLLAGAVAEVVNKAQVAPIASGPLCSDDGIFRPENQFCYVFKHGSILPYLMAEDSCSETDNRSTLLTITSKEEQDFVIKQFLNTSDVGSEGGVWLAMKTKDCSKWKIGKERLDLTFQNWNPNKEEMCTSMTKSGPWIKKPCRSPLNVICKKGVSLSCTGGEDIYCDYRHCYCFSHHTEEKKNWTFASADCKTRGADLASINSREEQEWLNSKYPPSDYGTWIGMTDIINEGTFKWLDKSTPLFKNWKYQQPDAYTPKENCVHYNIADCLDDKWNDEDCAIKSNYLCKKLASAS